jgi:transposase
VAAIVAPLMAVQRAAAAQVALADRHLRSLARSSARARQLMTVPAIGVVTSLAFLGTVDDPNRFARAGQVGAYVGLTPRRYQSGAMDYSGRISKCGDALTRGYLFEAAHILLRRVKRPSALQAWGKRLATRIGWKKATVAVARKLAVIMARMLKDGSDFQWQAA